MRKKALENLTDQVTSSFNEYIDYIEGEVVEARDMLEVVLGEDSLDREKLQECFDILKQLAEDVY
jgi:hypothetical protein